MTRIRRFLDLFVPSSVGILFCLFSFTAPAVGTGAKIYDALLSFRPPLAPMQEILIIETEAAAGSGAETRRWNLSEMAELLIVLKEQDARYAVLDLPLSENAVPGKASTIQRSDIQNAFDREFSRMGDNIQSLFEAIRTGSIRPKDSARYVTELVDLMGQGKKRLLDLLEGAERVENLNLARAMAFFGRTYSGMKIVPSVRGSTAAENQTGTSKELEELVLRKMALRRVTTSHDISPPVGTILSSPAIFLESAAGSGFTESELDPDGVRRSLLPVVEYRGRRLPQLAFAALRDRLGDPAIDLESDRIVLRQVKTAGSAARDIAIPLTEKGSVLMEWPASNPTVKFSGGFRRLSWSETHRYAQLEEDFLGFLREMERSGYLGERGGKAPLLSLHDYASVAGEELLANAAAGADLSRVQDWREARARFFDAAGRFLEGDTENNLVALADGMLSSDSLPPGEARRILVQRERTKDAFKRARELHSALVGIRGRLKESLSGSFCLVSPAASAAADAGRNRRGEPVSNAEVSAAFVNMILSNRLLGEIPIRYGAAIGALLSILASVAIMRLRPAVIAAVAAAWALLAVSICALLLVYGNFWQSPLAPAGGPFLACLTAFALKFRRRDEIKASVKP